MTACALTLALIGCEQPAREFTEPMVLAGRTVQPETLEQGKDLYRRHCASCHGDDGSGQGPAARGLLYSPRDFRKAEFSFVDAGTLPTHEQLVDRIREGVPERGMPMWKGMNEADLSALADYVKTFSPRWQQAQQERQEVGP